MSLTPNDPFPLGVEIGQPATVDDAQEPAVEPLVGVRDVVLVASGKGGVGKSTVAVNLAAALARDGQRVGLADADLYGPSVARMLGTGEGLERNDDGLVIPALTHGIWSVSTANVLPPEAALVWKGPLVTQALSQLFREVAWPDIDVLVVDMPPGTGDIHLTILEQIPVTGAVVVTTPQEMAVVDARRAIQMFHELDIPVFGLVENMADYICPCCGEAQQLFPSGGLERLARERSVARLASLPLDPGAQQQADGGMPLVLGQPESAASRAFNQLSQAVFEGIERERRFRELQENEDEQAARKEFWERLLDEDS